MPEPRATAAGRRNAARTREDLLTVAADEFAARGFFGARVDEIASRSLTTKRMIYYYFTDKRGLYTAVLEKAYADIREAEQALDLSALAPPQALQSLIRHTLEYHEAHPNLAKLVATENRLCAQNLKATHRQSALNQPIIRLIDDILDRGLATGDFRRRPSALELHLMMSGLAVFRITNAPTVEASFDIDIRTREHLDELVATVQSMMLAWLRTPEDGAGQAPTS
ncbi:TetR family transcriptional regulator [Piscicoccus intestinalis]|uniref:TetR family transcriptional regulator n=1 Tax=Piscicoccus intestinalis TaxID=746033 RepID=UPI000AB55886|nr:TetR family transcriptional regulator [Piscicoccus intestinalis]